jgi:CheY-like chemotaxis protein
VAPKVLCAYQTEEIFEFVKSALETFECEVIKATSEALALFLAQKNLPCLIVSELKADEDFGINLLSDLKADDELDQMPVVYLVKRWSKIALPRLDLPEGAAMLIWYPLPASEFAESVRRFIAEPQASRLPESPE